MGAQHKDIGTGEVHILANWVVNSLALRDVIPVGPADIGKVCWVRGTGGAISGFYALANDAPLVWERIGGGTLAEVTLDDADTLSISDTAGATVTVALPYEHTLSAAGSSPETKYLNGNKTWTVLTKASLALDQVDNTSDANKPVSTAQATAILAAQNYAVQRSNHTGTQLAATISDFSTAVGLAAPVKTVNGATGDVAVTTASIGAVATADIGVTVAPLTAGKIPSSYLPAIAISDYLGSVASQAAMLALVGERGDWCTRSDTSQTFILTNENPSVLASWQPIITPGAVISVNGNAGVVVVNAALGASFVATTGVLTVSKNNGQASDIIQLAPTQDIVDTGATGVTCVSGRTYVSNPSNSNCPGYSLPAGVAGAKVTILYDGSTASVFTVYPNGADSISGGTGGDSVTYKQQGRYIFSYYNGTWNVQYYPKNPAGRWRKAVTSVVYAQPNDWIEAYNSTIVLPTTGLIDGDTVTVRNYVKDNDSTHIASNTITSAAPKYIRAQFATSGTATSLSASSVIDVARGADSYIEFTYNSSLNVWFYKVYFECTGTFSDSAFKIAKSGGFAAATINCSAITGVSLRTIYAADNDVDLATVPRTNSSSGNFKPSGTNAAIVAGQGSKAGNARVCTVTGHSIQSSLQAPGAVIRGNQDVSSTISKVMVADATYKTRTFATGSGPYTATAYPTETGANTATGASTTHIPATLRDTLLTGSRNVGLHEFRFVLTTNDATPKVFCGTRRVICQWDGTTSSVLDTATLGTDYDPQSLAPSISFSISNHYLVATVTSTALSASGIFLNVSADIHSVYNGD